MAELSSGTEVAGCRIESVLGRGGMGVVYRAKQLSLDRTVAVKAIAPDLAMDVEFRERFQHESRLAASIEHPNVIPVYEAGEKDGLLYLIMRMVEGTDLRALLDKEGALEPRRAARLVAQVAAALAAAHRRGLVHRDVKPANVLISSAGDEEHAYLTDFGIARELEATGGLTRTGAVVGTLDYIAPERLENPRGDARSDIYALGCVLFETLTGSVPFPLDSGPAKMYAHVSAPVPSARELEQAVPEELDDLVRHSMAKDPDDRPASAREMAETLLAFAARAPGAPWPARGGAAGAAAPSQPDAAADPAAEPPRPSAPTEPSPPEAGPTEPLVESAATERLAEPGPTEPLAEPDPAAPAATRPAASAAERRDAPSTRGDGGRQPPRGAILAGLAALAIVVVVAVLALAGGGSDDGGGDDGQGNGNSPPTDEPLAPVALDPVELSPGADGVAVGAGFVWVADKDDNVVRRVDLGTRREAGATAVGEEPDSLAIGEGSVWVTNSSSDSVSRIDTKSFKVVKRIAVGSQPEGIAVGDGAVWVANGGGGSVTRFAVDGSDSVTTPVGSEPVQLALTPDAAWVTVSGDAGTIVPLDLDTGERAGDPVSIGGTPRGIAFADGLLWVSATKANQVVAVDPGARKVVKRIRVGANPREVRAGEGGVWVTNAATSEVTAIDTGARKVAGKVKVQGQPYGLGVGEGLVWAAGLDNGLLTPIRPTGG